MSDGLASFFAQYPGFTYDPSRTATDEFSRMCRQLGWNRKSEERDDAWLEFRDALVVEFNTIYGTDMDDVESWKALCRILGISPVPDDLNICRQRVKSVFVNLVDLVHVHQSGGSGTIRLFRSESELSNYTQMTGKYFPKDNAYAGGLLKYLLRNIMAPGARRGRGSRRQH